MKRAIGVYLFLAMSVLTAYAQEGAWSGDLSVQGIKLPLVFNFSADGCTLDSPKQGAKGVKAEWVKSDDGSVKVSIPTIGASYEGVYDGKEIKGTFRQSGTSLPLTLTQGTVAINRPQTPQAPFPYTTEEVTFNNYNVRLNGTLTLPEGCTEETPVLIMVTGSGQQNRDEELFGHRPFAVIADALARRGIATLRYDDRFYGDQSEVFSNYTTYHLEQDAVEGVNYLRKRFKHVGVIGHSEGGSIALTMAAEGEADFIISLAGMVTSGKETIMAQSKNGLMRAGISAYDVEKYCGALRKAFDAFIDGKHVEDLSEPTDMPALLKSSYDVAMKQAGTPWFRYFLSVNPSLELSKITCPVLALNGTLDSQVDCKTNLGLLEKGLKKGKCTIKAMEGLNHLFQHCTTGAATEYGDIEETISPEVLDIIADWVKAL